MASIIVIKKSCVYSEILNLNDKDLIKTIESALSFRILGAQYSKAFKEGKWDGFKRLFYPHSMKFQSGLCDRVSKLIENAGYKCLIQDDFPDIEESEEIPFNDEGRDEREYQTISVNQAIKHKSGIIRIATGGGKTSVIAMIAAKLNQPTVIYVPGVYLLHQTKKEFDELLGEDVCGIVGDGIVDIKRITIATMQTAVGALDKKYERFDDEEELEKVSLSVKNKMDIKSMIEKSVVMAVDECHCIASNTIQSIAKASTKAVYRLGFSATPWRDDNHDLLIEGVTGRRLVNYSASYLIEKGYLVQPKFYVIGSPEYTEDLNGTYIEIYPKYIVNFEERNKLLAKAANKLALEMGRTILILVRRVAHGKKIIKHLDKKVKYAYLDGSQKYKKLRETIADDVRDGTYNVLITTSIFDAGINIKKLDAMILAGSGKSSVKAFQRPGRIMRLFPGKNNAIIVLPLDDGVKYFGKHARETIEAWETEPKFIIKKPKNMKKASKKPVDKPAW